MTPRPDSDLPWNHTIGKRPFRIQLVERREKQGLVYARYTARAGKAAGTRVNVRLGDGLVVRGATDRLSPALVRTAIALGEKLHAQLVLGMQDDAARAVTRDASLDITVGGGLALWLDPERGAFRFRTKQVTEYERAAKVATENLGADTPWASLSTETLRDLWIKLFAAWVPGQRGTGGPGAMQLVGITLITAELWLVRKGLLQATPLGNTKSWKLELDNTLKRCLDDIEKEQKSHAMADPRWQALKFDHAGRRAKNRERYTAAQFGAALCAARDQKVDPRVGLLYQLAAEARLGPASRARRSDLHLESEPFAPYGHLLVRGRQNKAGGIVAFTSEERAAVDHALGPDGYLRELEAARRVGKIVDYPLFPGHALTRRAAAGSGRYVRMHPDASYAPVLDRCLHDWYAALEHLAGITKVPDRNWRASRRTATDIALELGVSAEDADALGFWESGTKTREGVYADPEHRLKVRAARAQVVRTRVRMAALHAYALELDAARSGASQTVEAATQLTTEVAHRAPRAPRTRSTATPPRERARRDRSRRSS